MVLSTYLEHDKLIEQEELDGSTDCPYSSCTYCFKLLTYSTNARTGRPVMPVSMYGLARVSSIEPAISICAQLMTGSFPSTPSTPSTKCFKNNAAVALPAGTPPVCHRKSQ